VIFYCRQLVAQISGDFGELFEGGFQVFDDFLSQDVRIGEIVGFFEAFNPPLRLSRIESQTLTAVRL